MTAKYFKVTSVLLYLTIGKEVIFANVWYLFVKIIIYMNTAYYNLNRKTYKKILADQKKLTTTSQNYFIWTLLLTY